MYICFLKSMNKLSWQFLSFHSLGKTLNQIYFWKKKQEARINDKVNLILFDFDRWFRVVCFNAAIDQIKKILFIDQIDGFPVTILFFRFVLIQMEFQFLHRNCWWTCKMKCDNLLCGKFNHTNHLNRITRLDWQLAFDLIISLVLLIDLKAWTSSIWFFFLL